MKTSEFLKLNLKDITKGFILVFLTSLISLLMTYLDASNLPTWAEFLISLKVSSIAGLAYILKNLLTNSQDAFLKKE